MKIDNTDEVTVAVNKERFSDLQSYITMSTKSIEWNIRDALGLLEYLPEDSLLRWQVDILLQKTDITWSFILSELPDSEKLKDRFFENESRTLDTDDWKSIVRWQEYIQSIDPNIRSKQKVKNMISIITSWMELISQLKFTEISENDKLRYIWVLDYIKNAYVTLFNTLIIPEKKWADVANSKAYLLNRWLLLKHVNESTKIYYSSFIDSQDNTQSLIDEKDIEECKSQLESIKQYMNDKMFSRSLSRPEATHPISLLSSCWLIVERYPHVDVVIALPWWSTELWSLAKYLYEVRYNKEVNLHMLPVSFHSSKNQWVNSWNREEYFRNVVAGLDLDWKEILIIDDNSSTWKTLQYVSELLQTKRPSSLIIKVMEADIVRSTIDRENLSKRPQATNPDVYDCAVWVLPVSKSLSPKVDIKEIKEKQRILKYYKNLEESSDGIDAIKYSIYQDAIIDSTNDHIDRWIDMEDKNSIQNEQQRNNSIVKFRWTFLSNFYPCDVVYGDVIYPSTEHAYQWAKYPKDIFSQLNEEQLSVLNEKLKLKWHSITIAPWDDVFNSNAFASWNIKVISTQLDERWYCRPDWNEVKLNVMLTVLLQKFEDPELKKRLAETKWKYLIEWNTWDDVFWGWSNGRGNNYLWRCLMYIRDQL